MAKLTREAIMQILVDEDVEFIRLQFTDMFGTMKNVAITSGQMEKALDNKCMIDGTSMEGFVRIEETDMYLYPDFDTFVILPWRPQQGKVARLICDICRPDRTPLENSSRYILQKVLEEAKEMGYIFKAGPELEFFLYHTDENGIPTTLTHEKAGYFDLGPLDLGENARRDMVLTLEDMGFDVESSHHEMAPAQHEIDFKYASALKAADDVMTYKFAIRTIAKRHGLHATFMPKPCVNVNGSGMHVNMSLWTVGKNLFADREDPLGLSREAYYFVGGIMKHIRGMTAILNPLVNSYKRLVPGFEAPVYNVWSRGTKNPLIRVPYAEGSDTRIELRSPDPSANPYLVLAVCLAAGLDGIKNQIMPPEMNDQDLTKLTREELEAMGLEMLPANLMAAVCAMKKDELVTSVLGKSFTGQYTRAREAEWFEYQKQVSEWELEQYLYRI